MSRLNEAVTSASDHTCRCGLLMVRHGVDGPAVCLHCDQAHPYHPSLPPCPTCAAYQVALASEVRR